ncbi:MAG: hypothetical protein ACOYB4_00690 [Methyloceanibacter sp.]
MPAQPRHNRKRKRPTNKRAEAKPVFVTMAEAGASSYLRARDLPKLIALWPRELADESLEGRLYVLGKLRHALRAERRRALSGHWSYDLNRHLGLLSAYKAEFARLSPSRSKARMMPWGGKNHAAART